MSGEGRSIEKQEREAEERKAKADRARRWLAGELDDPELASRQGDGRIEYENVDQLRDALTTSGPASESGLHGDSYLSASKRREMEAAWALKRKLGLR
jgi:hypothetical protein